jgi:hypothetical protein
MPLSADELTVIDSLAYPLPRASRAAFTAAVESALAAYAVHDVGLVHRVASGLQRNYMDPPRVTAQPQHFNSRKHSPEGFIHHGRER